VSTAERRWPALDGLRAVAIVCVVAYHLGHLAGGWLGVDVFFVLSGYLITTLLLTERAERGTVNLRKFWARRARRLLPAVLLLLSVIGIYSWAGGPGIVGAQLRSPGLATLFYVANWQQIAASNSYFTAFTAPNPLVHMWSLAIEEQYYLFWPLMVAGVSALAVRSRHRRAAGAPTGAPRALLVLSIVLLVASATWMGVCAHLESVNRAYLGTDTRAWELLLGGIGAMVARPGVSSSPNRLWSWASIVGAAGLVAVIVLAGTGNVTAQPPTWVWNGGLVAGAGCTLVVLIGSIRAPRGPLARVLSIRPVRWFGWVSYSLYLWHVPVIDFLTPATTGLSGISLLAARLAAMAVTTCASYYLVEQPLRRADWASWRRRSLVPLGIGATAALLVAGTVSPVLAGTGAIAGVAQGGSTETPAKVSPLTPANFSLPATERPTPGHPIRVWVLGDSVMNDGSPGVTAALQATGDATVVADSSFGGWGLTRVPHWKQDEQAIIAQYRPQLIIGTWSWDDQMAQSSPVRYRALMHQFLATLLAPGNGVRAVVLLQFPQSGPETLYYQDPVQQKAVWTEATLSQDAWNRIAQEAVGQFPGRAAYLSTSELFAPNGRFLAWMRTASGSWVRARKVDDTHICPFGAAAFGELVVSALSTPLGLGPLAPGWQSGAWSRDPRYNDPAGSCPNDQPPSHYNGLPIPVAAPRAR